MNQAILSLSQPLNNTEIQNKTNNTPETKDDNFSGIFDNAVQEQSGKTSQKDHTAYDSSNKRNENDISEKGNKVIHASKDQIKTDNIPKVENSNFETSKDISAKEFLEKLGLGEETVQKILQTNGLSENSTLLELLDNLNFTLDNPDTLLETPAIDFLKKLGIDDEKIKEIVQLITEQIENLNENTVDEKTPPVVSVKNLFENAGLNSEKQTAAVAKDFSVNDFFKKLGLSEKEVSNLTKTLIADKSLNDKALVNLQRTDAKDFLKQMGLSSDEITKVLEINFENSDYKNKIKNMVLNKDFSALKNLVSPEKFNVNLPGKPELQGMFQVVNKNTAPGTFTAKVQPEIVLPTNPVLDSSTVSPMQSSGSMNGTNAGGGTNGYTQMTNISNEIPTNSRLQEATPKAFFEKTVVDQIVSKVNFKVTAGREEINIKLDPPSLGSLNLKLSVEGKTVNAVIVADNNMTKEIVQSNLQQLKDSMVEQGLKVDNISVSVGDGSSRDKDMDEFKMLLTKGQNNELEDENNSNLIEQSQGIYHKAGYMFSQDGVDLFV